jgi:hypothetical protein
VPPPLLHKRQAPDAVAPVLDVDAYGPIADNDKFSAPLGAPISAIASELEPAPLAPKLPEQPQPRASVRPKSYRALVVGGAAGAITAALIAIAATGRLGNTALQPELSRSAHAGAQSTQVQARAQPTASAVTAQTTPRDAAGARSPYPPDHATTPPAHETVVPTPIPPGSKAAELLQQAKRARDGARPIQAEALLSEVLTQYPGDFGARYHMALTLVRLHRLEEAHAQLSKALEVNDASAGAWLLQGDIFLQEGRGREALRAWKRCLAVEAAYPSCQQRLTRWLPQ